ncbi:MAG: trehalose-phosphatase [Roseiarcus sp.]
MKASIDAPPPDRMALFLDVDGTLLDLAASPTAVVVPGGLVECIAGVEQALGGALALVSGRTLGELDRLFSPLRLRASGVHGAEIRYDPLTPAVIVDAAVALPARLWRSLNACLADFPGAFAENKRFSFAVHYRAAPSCAADLREALRRLVAAEAVADVEIIDARLAFEIKGRGFDKGSAINRFLTRSPFAGRVPIFIGDDWTDEAGFAAVVQRHGAAYSVGRVRPGVTGVFSEPSMVRDWLESLATQMARP